MKKYVTTNIRLEEADYRTLKLRALRDRKSLASLVRDAVRQVYQAGKGKPVTEEEWRNAPFWKLIGIYRGGPDDADRHDEIIYDEELEKRSQP